MATNRHRQVDQFLSIRSREEIARRVDREARASMAAVRHELRASAVSLVLALGVLLSSCVHQQCTALMSFFGCVERRDEALWQDRSIKFPQFRSEEPVIVGAQGGTFQLDGTILQALQVAANDFLPVRQGRACLDTQVAQKYSVIRQGDVIFIRIDEDPGYCGEKYGALDSGASYAVSVNGRILRRVLDGEPMYDYPDTPDGGVVVDPSEVGKPIGPPVPPFGLEAQAPDAGIADPGVLETPQEVDGGGSDQR